MTGIALIWFRRDLRLDDNPALLAAVNSGHTVLPLFIDDRVEASTNAEGAASDWWLHNSLAALSKAIEAQNGTLVLKRGPALACLRDVIKETGATAVFWNRRYEPWCVTRDTEIKTALTEDGLTCGSFAADMLAEPWEIKTGAGKPFSVFSPFWKALLASPFPEAPVKQPKSVPWFQTAVSSDALGDWGLTPSTPNWAAGFHDIWSPGEAGAHAALAHFLEGTASDYSKGRNFPGLPSVENPAVSRLSPHLHFGEISPRRIWSVTKAAEESGSLPHEHGFAFLREVGWRDFNRGLLFHNPHTVTEAFRPTYDSFPWQRDDAALRAWQRGKTGYPFVDAGMRELWATGYMHNRVRMVVASFLVKHLLIDWRAGEAWFRDTLVDADLANNVGGWQWTAGCGADAAPYFRIFNPIGQGEKFDTNGTYTRKWVPELKLLPNEFLHRPWEAPALVLKAADVTLGDTYPNPIVDHREARERALNAYGVVKTANSKAA